MSHRGRIVRTLDEFNEFVSLIAPDAVVAADVETYKQRPSQQDARLLGLALSSTTPTGEPVSAYVVFEHYNKIIKQFEYITDVIHLSNGVSNWLLKRVLVGWNVPFDNSWITYHITPGDTLNWLADGRILWHLQNNDFTIRGFGLKLAQEKLLGWEERNDKALEEHVALSGGKLKNGDHYLADLDVLSHYACLDTLSTLEAFNKLRVFIDKHDYWQFSSDTLNYAILLHEAASSGLPVDADELLKSKYLYENRKSQIENTLRSVCAKEIEAIEETWKVKKAAAYKQERTRERYLNNQVLHRRFNPASGPQRELLMHTLLGYPVNETTPTGRAKTDRANLTAIPHAGAKALVQYSEYKKVAEQAQTYLDHTENGSVYTNYDVCGTVSGRLSGFRPSILNMPFSEEDIMKAFPVREGFVGIHADLAAIEPCVLAHYSEDPTLLKVYRQGQGDIYLDLALDIFPTNALLRDCYDPLAPITSDIKETFKDLRAICKIIHLAVSYTGTYITVAKNLNKAGYLTTKGEAMSLVKRYWQKFSRVKAFNQRLQQVYDDRGHLRNLTGRIVQVPEIYKKDLMNRLVQSSAHDILRLWVMNIVDLFKECGIEYQYHLIDLHDATGFMVRQGQEERAKEIFIQALKLVEEQVNMSVPIRCEVRFYKTLAGLKNNE